MANAEKLQPGEIYAVTLETLPAGVPWYELPFCFTPYWKNPKQYT